MTLHEMMAETGRRALRASRELALVDAGRKKTILSAMADAMDRRRTAIQAANAVDMEEGKKKGLSPALLDRLQLTDGRINAMIAGVRDVAGLHDPLGEVLEEKARPNGLVIRKVRVPIGVIAVIYEARPNVTADAASLCIKSSNAVILRGGSESLRSNKAIAEALQEGGALAGLPAYAVQLIDTPDREAVKELVQLEGFVDLAIPRGGEGLIRAVAESARVPVIKHYKGVCHLYVDEGADEEMALAICENAKCQRPGVCNAIETLLVHESRARTFIPRMASRLGQLGVELRGDDRARAFVPSMKTATEDDWYAEYLDLILAVRVVPDLAGAIDHINTYGSHHSDAIVTPSTERGDEFLRKVDSAAVYVNASTRFTDGAEFGLGAEMGISTDKLHARGPMGIDGLTTYKYVITGNGQVRS
jgi:glutamate-5-semialdehyde dehydrogenase